MDIKRRTLFSAMFDAGSTGKAFDIPVVTGYVEDGKYQVRVCCGWLQLEVWKNPKPITDIDFSKMNTLKKLYSHIKYCLSETMLHYKGEKVITDFYKSPYFEDCIMMEAGYNQPFSNQDEPTNY